MEVVIEIISWFFIYSEEIFEVSQKDGQKKWCLLLAGAVYVGNLALFGVFGYIALGMVNQVICRPRVEAGLLLVLLFIFLTGYFGRQVYGYSRLLWDRWKK